eukprot:CAMPEP_0197197980 /NCGR_PEP_ID=MMETSP1423-20130617/33143_1 /TAXON_ID=476441 /ORGANISM="Pseudo-nitzschia heimii, Strain UNC1101" /LENGTH=430 /DNA_ID=CAMNT_0042651809 /DNA_START=63 /DNA_END=1351 /DNA_ORIENTATION=-
MESLDVERAYDAYRKAASQLQRKETIVPSSSDEERARAEVLIQTLEKMGGCQVSIGDQDLAKEHFSQSLKLLEEGANNNETAKNENYYETHSSLCFYIGQLSLKNEALEAYRHGIRSLEECMRRVDEDKNVDSETLRQEADTMDDSITEDIEKANDDAVMKIDDDTGNSSSRLRLLLTQKLSGAYCNLAELYLTDLCDEDTAEIDCEGYLEKALQLRDADGEPFVDALQTMASLRLSQNDKRTEAVPFILRAYQKQRVGSEALATLVGLGEEKGVDSRNGDIEPQAQELLEVEAANNLPEFEFRCQTAKLLLECAGLLHESATTGKHGNHTKDECVAAAISVLGSLLAQNDEVIEIWYLTGCAFAAKTPPPIGTAKFYLERARDMLTDIRKALTEEVRFADDDADRLEIEEQLEMNATQMKDVQSKLDEL